VDDRCRTAGEVSWGLGSAEGRDSRFSARVR
jgi:hypothetical protein